jgi:hypothetical protein
MLYLANKQPLQATFDLFIFFEVLHFKTDRIQDAGNFFRIQLYGKVVQQPLVRDSHDQ